jgi:hypothetical protein
MGQAAEQAVEPVEPVEPVEQAEQAAKMGRPSLYSDALAREICERVAASDVGLLWVCAADDMPSAATVKRWLHDRDDFRAMYTRAKEDQGAHQGERAVQAVIEETDPARARVLFDAFKWSAAKLAPRQYGDTAALRLLNAAGDGDATLRIEANVLADELTGLLTASYVDVTPSPDALPAPSEEPKGRGP